MAIDRLPDRLFQPNDLSPEETTALGNRPYLAAIQRTDRIFVTKTEPAAVAAATVPNRTG